MQKLSSHLRATMMPKIRRAEWIIMVNSYSVFNTIVEGLDGGSSKSVVNKILDN